MIALLSELPRRLASLSPRAERAALIGFTLAVLIVALAVLVLPGRTFIGRYVHDILIFLDGADRVLEGQVPNRDFHTPLGPLAVLLPAFGLWLSGSLGGMFPVATAAFALLLAPILIHACGSRLPLPYAIGFAFYTLILVIAPLNPGEPVEALTFAMFYNRFCWAALGLLFLYLLPARGAPRPLLDGVAMASLLLLMLYLKVSYAAVGLAFTLAFLAIPRVRRSALVALGAALAGAVLVGLLWRGTGTYLADIGVAAQASGAVRGTLFTLSRTVLENFTSCLLLAAAVAIAFARGARLDFLLLALAMGGAGVVLLNQNAQPSGILTMLPAAVVATLAPRRADAAGPPASTSLGSIVLLLVIGVPFALTATVALGYHAVKAVRANPADPRAQLDRLFVPDRKPPSAALSADDIDAIYRRGGGDLAVLNQLGVAGMPEGERSYLHTVYDGIDLLRGNRSLAGSTFVFDMANPFNALLDRDPPRRVDAWNHDGRTFSATVYRPAQEMFSDVDVVLIPRKPRTLATTLLLDQVYGNHIRSQYQLVTSSTYWHAWVKSRP